MLGPSSNVSATSRRSLGPWLTTRPNHCALVELAPIQHAIPKARAAPPALTGIVDRAGDVVFVGAVTAWVVVLALILRHRVFVSHDSMSNYAHVWYVSDRLRRAHLVPFHMPVVGHGQAYAFPYAFVPW